MTNPITLYYHLGKELRPAAMDPKEKQELQRQLKDDTIHAKRVQDMASMRHVLESVAPQVMDLVTRYWNNAVSWQDLPTLLKKELKNHKNKDMLVDAIKNEAHQIKKGSGKREDSGGLYDYEIEQLPFHKDGFEGVIASDQLDELKPKQCMSFIMNLDNSHQPGSHWVACNIDAKGDKSIEYYDSFGDDPSTDFMRRMKQLVEEIDPDVYLKFKVNRVIDQAVNTDTCGLHAIKWLINRYRGVPFKEATGYSDVRREEKRARAMEQRYKKFGYL
ncbi:hypothetical protein SAMD00019534_117480 [Acytostelium subglobosum LB1]|uniref:hypothetical protein n=1 Tax=Acytostelium subglobosum LB1 TaxID=1410327 RepID=UPI000644B4C7|nr:hypothetical protein SAMD00019534_117480 [Acytostelium subglobosum LB1]GAM28572.1 hypothetical protein SAMD00019534_117480 [Acytostelium subglobosum LB1]|eukprot:XP_012748350.1 hypothetical protein SAMD00019534_117480 [Acytostelium subglobosum LB1]